MTQTPISLTLLTCLIVFGNTGTAFSDSAAVFACNEFPPYKMENSPTGLPGFDVEFLEEAFKRVDVSLNIQFMPWKRALEEGKKGTVNGVCSCSSTEERSKYFHFSSPLGKASSGVFSLAKNNFSKISHIEEVGSQSIGVIKGYNILENLKRASVDNIIELSDEKQGLQMLLKGRLDYYYSYEAPTRFYLDKISQASEIQYNEISFTHYYSCFSKAAKNSETLLQKFNAGLALIRKDGTYNKILAKYR